MQSLLRVRPFFAKPGPIIRRYASGTASYDVLVVGFGAAGASAAIEAATAGASVCVIDRGYGGGASTQSGGVVYAGGTKYQKEAGIQDTPGDMFNYLKQETRGCISDKKLKEFCDTSAEQIEWLEEHGCQFGPNLCEFKTDFPPAQFQLYYSGSETAYPYKTTAKPAPRGHRPVGKGLCGSHIFSNLRKSALALGVVFRPLTRAHSLIIENKRVVGLKAYETSDNFIHKKFKKLSEAIYPWHRGAGSLLDNLASKVSKPFETEYHARSIILSAGGFIQNDDMIAKYNPHPLIARPLGTAGDDGKGIELGLSAGGKVEYMHNMTVWRFISPPTAFMEGVSVGPSGERIANEDLYGATHSEVMMLKHGGRGWLILDSRSWKKAKSQIKEQVDNPARIMKSYILRIQHNKASTLTDLALKCGIDSLGLRKTVESYNTGCFSAWGDPSGKSDVYCAGVVEPPFYAVNISIKDPAISQAMAITVGGLVVNDDDNAVLKNSSDGETVPGLYAAGRTAVGLPSNGYVSGLSLADCVFSGRRAGKAAAVAAAHSKK